MTTDTTDGSATVLAPDDAFSVLGNETRMGILQALGEADEPMSFSELRDRVGMRDSGQFNYHLRQLDGHFIRQTDEGYELQQPGQRIIDAVLSGAITETPDRDRTRADRDCPYCGAPVVVEYDPTSQRPLKGYCTECRGAEGWIDRFEYGQVGALRFSPAGLQDRSPAEQIEAAITWEHLEQLAAANEVCPRCSGRIEHTISVCETHDPADGVCSHCDRWYASQVSSRCVNCLFNLEEGFLGGYALVSVQGLAFLIAHGLDPFTEEWGQIVQTADEEVLSVAPFEARYTFTMDDDVLTVTLDSDLSVIAASNDPTTGTQA